MKLIHEIVLCFLCLKIIKTDVVPRDFQKLFSHQPNEKPTRDKFDELIFHKNSNLQPTIQLKKSEIKESTKAPMNIQNEMDLDKSVQNILQIDSLSKENVKQFELITDCQTRLKSMESELDKINSHVEQMTSRYSKTPRYLVSKSRDVVSTRQLKKSDRTAGPLRSSGVSNFFNSQVMQDIRNQFINHLNHIPKIFLSLAIASLLTPTNLKMISSTHQIRCYFGILFVALPLLIQLSHANKNVLTFSVASGSFQDSSEQYSNDMAEMHRILNSKNMSQIRSLSTLSFQILTNIKAQNKKNREDLSECYQELGKFTRILMANKKRARPTVRPKSGDHSFETRFELIDGSEAMKEVNYGNNKYQLPVSLVQELGFYLAEMEKNYNTINELRTRIKHLEESKLIHINRKFNTNISTEQNGCLSNVGIGYAQLTAIDEMKSLESFKERTVLCEDKWLVIQLRQSGFETSFNRTWSDYSEGFGYPRGDFWLGLRTISALTQRKSHRLLIELVDWSDQVFVAEYEHFEVGGEADFYRLSLSDKYAGNASRDFLDDVYYGFLSQNGAYFSTYDNNRAFRTNESTKNGVNTRNCALKSGGGWWFNNNYCLPVNLNGIYVTGASAPSARGIKWQAVRVHDRNYSLKKAKMKIMPNV